MNPKWKLTAYAALVILSVWFGLSFYSNYSEVTAAAAPDTSAEPPAPPPDTNSITSNTATTNAVAASDTNVPATNNPDTNVATPPGTNLAVAPDTNAPHTLTNAPAPRPKPPKKPAAPVNLNMARGAMIAYLGLFIGSLIGLGLLITHDVTQFMGSRAVDYFFGDAADAIRDPEYDRAEAEWANGKYLEAIQLMRDFLQKNPRQIHAALRIAEIYEKDLKNPLAAALEYEEVLKHKLPAERWGWAAVHLCNLYSRLNKSDQALALLRRVVHEYPKTAAAKKARARLGIAEPEPEPTEHEVTAEANPELTPDTNVITMEEHPPELEPRTGPASTPSTESTESTKPTQSNSTKPNLPPGFRPKK
jgi:TolA-binding protein